MRCLQLRSEHVEHDLHVLVSAGLHVLMELQYATVACITIYAGSVSDKLFLHFFAILDGFRCVLVNNHPVVEGINVTE